MKVIAEPERDLISGREMGRRLKIQLSELQKEMVKKRMERKHEEVEFLEHQIDQLHRRLMAFRNQQ